MLHNLLIHKGKTISPQEREKLPAQFTNPFSYVPDNLCREAALSVQQYLQSQLQWHDELQAGKMFGVLVVETPERELGYLAAFSGNLQGKNNHEFFVPPVCDLLHPDNFFKLGEREISAMNDEISAMEMSSSLRNLQAGFVIAKSELEGDIAQLKQTYKEGKKARDERRKMILKGEVSGDTAQLLEEIARESQFQKAEIKRAERRYKEILVPFEMQLGDVLERIEMLKRKRKEMSAALQEQIFKNFTFLNAKGEEKSLLGIFRDYYNDDPDVLPPGGAGECAAPKLLQYAFEHGFKPVSMAEFWWGDSPKGEIRRHGEFYPSCKGKCAPILGFMLQGLEIMPAAHQSFPEREIVDVLYEDEWIVAVDKPSGVLSVAGKDSDEKCVADLLGEHGWFVVHRLDMHTSGVLLLAKTQSVYKDLQRQFAGREVEKCYVALLEGVDIAPGMISLPLAPDYDHRPCQKVDFECGKEAVTRLEVLHEDTESGRTLVKFYPITGRTHQLRVHAAHPMGLNSPIVGDLLYGSSAISYDSTAAVSQAGRLMLHAHSLKFIHPVSQSEVEIVSPLPFCFRF